MFITQLEYREKASNTNWRRISFPLRANFTSADATLPVRLLNIIAELPAFGANAPEHGMVDIISRVVLKAGHCEFMWFAKTFTENGAFQVEEEELYDQDNHMLMRRGMDELAIGDAPVEKMPMTHSMLALHPEIDALQKLQKGFQLVQHYTLTEENKAYTLQQILSAPHGTLILVDGSQLTEPFDLSSVLTRNDLQVLAANCSGLPEMTITKTGKMINCK